MGSHIGQIGGHNTILQYSLTRPADTTAYTSGDAVADATTPGITFANAAREAGQGFAVKWGKLSKNKNTVTSITFRLWLFKAAPSSVPVDNAAYGLLAADNLARVGYIDFTTGIAGTDCADYYGTVVPTNLGIKLDAGQTLYGVLQATAAYTPDSGEVFRIHLGVDQD